MLKAKYRWVSQAVDQARAEALAAACHVSLMTAQLLILRGAGTPDCADLFLHPEKDAFHDPFEMRGMDKAVARIRQAIANHQDVRIFGDYDVDGVTATSLFVRALRQAKASVSWFIPNRFRDGYGPNVSAVEAAAEAGVRLIVTVDSGIAAPAPAARARELGIDYIVTDHHQPPPDLPEAFAVLNPKQPGCPYPFKELSGAGVVLKIVQALFPDEQFDPRWLDLAAIGTIADLVPLLGENRKIACQGLKQINGGSYAGINALKKQAGTAERVDSEAVGFQLGPRLNAAGRLEDAAPAMQLLLTDDQEEAARAAQQLDELNRDRKALVETITEQADSQAQPYVARGDRALVLAGAGWHQGVIGIAASKLVERYYRPVIMLSIDEEKGVAKGSGRSVEAFDLYAGLSACASDLRQFGGHTMAAGLTIDQHRIDDFRSDFAQYAAQSLEGKPLVASISVAGTLTPDEVTPEFIAELSDLAPFGISNPKPVFELDAARLQRVQAIGRNKDHLKLMLKGRSSTLDAIGFRLGEAARQIASSDRVSVLGGCAINEWNGFRKAQFIIQDLRVDGVQVFDWRSETHVREKMNELSALPATYLAFRSDTKERLRIECSVTPFSPDLVVTDPVLVLLDLPQTEADLAALYARSPAVDRIYACFSHARDHYFTAFPQREQFTWLYRVILTRQAFPIDPTLRQIAKHKGWSERMVYFMTRVFFELGFVRIEKGILHAVHAPEKKPLSASKTYQNEKKQLELEDLFCYSPISSLKNWFDLQKTHRGEAVLLEETIDGL
ncbi:MAG: single-stranded-DNA-specific exonuclease RecJ [Sporolactobacillus sp.]